MFDVTDLQVALCLGSGPELEPGNGSYGLSIWVLPLPVKLTPLPAVISGAVNNARYRSCSDQKPVDAYDCQTV